MSVRSKWRVVKTPDYEMAGSGSYILFAESQAGTAGIFSLSERRLVSGVFAA